MTKGSLSTLLFAITTCTRVRNCLLWHFYSTSCLEIVDHLTVQYHFNGRNNGVTLASILDSDTFIEEQPINN